MKILVTGGAGFIGSHFAKLAIEKGHEVVVYDLLTYAGNKANLKSISDNSSFTFVKGDICDRDEVAPHIDWADAVVNFAAETHVDRSILQPDAFVKTDVIGTATLLDCCRKKNGSIKYLQISTDEVYGSIDEGSFTEESPLEPRSPYAASKASADLMVLSYWNTYKLPVLITRSSNNYGPNQYPEKLIPFFVTRGLTGENLPLYGDGKNIRDWLHVEDNCLGIYKVLMNGEFGQVYNIGGDCEKENIYIADKIAGILKIEKSRIKFVEDRAGHDRRYSLSINKMASMGWKPEIDFEKGIETTVNWYVENREWWEDVLKKSADYKAFIAEYYKNRQ